METLQGTEDSGINHVVLKRELSRRVLPGTIIQLSLITLAENLGSYQLEMTDNLIILNVPALMTEISGKKEKGLLWETCEESKLILELQMNKASKNTFIFEQRNRSYLKLKL